MNMKTLLLLLILGSVVIFAWSGYQRSDIQESRYATAALAQEAGAAQRGWLPKFLPPSATDIRERHSLDTNAVILRFSFDPAESGFWREACQPLTGDRIGHPEGLPVNALAAGTSWWPGDISSGEETPPGRVHFFCPEASLFLAIDAKNSSALAWTADKRS